MPQGEPLSSASALLENVTEVITVATIVYRTVGSGWWMVLAMVCSCFSTHIDLGIVGHFDASVGVLVRMALGCVDVGAKVEIMDCHGR